MSVSMPHLCPLLLLSLCLTSAHALINGTVVRQGRFPFIASLQWDRAHKCGGTLVSPDTVLTVAHCIPLVYKDPSQPTRVSVLLGASNQRHPEPGSVREAVSHVILHPLLPGRKNFTWDFVISHSILEMPYDYAILKLARRVASTPNIQVARLAAPGMPRINDECTALGWGRFSYPDVNETFAAKFSTYLRRGTIRVVNVKVHGVAFRLPKTMLNVLSGSPPGARDVALCFGDSGSPVVCRDGSGQAYVGGMAEAAALPCNYPYRTAIIMRVDPVLTWIRNYAGDGMGNRGTA